MGLIMIEYLSLEFITSLMFQRCNCMPKAPTFKYELFKSTDMENEYFMDIFVLRGIELPKQLSAFDRDNYSQVKPTKWETTWLHVSGHHIDGASTLDEAKELAKKHFELNAHSMESRLN